MNPKTLSLATFAAAGLLCTALATPAASAQVNFGIRIGQAPPPLRYEVRPNAPGEGYVWTEGYYEPYRGAYRWHPGIWARPPYQGAYYNHPHWDHYPDGWHQHEGYWARGGDDDHHDEREHDRDHYWDNHPH